MRCAVSEKHQSKAIWSQGSCEGETGGLKAAGDGAGYIASFQAVGLGAALPKLPERSLRMS